MSCQCHQIGGPFIAEDPNCEAHGWEAQQRERETEEIYVSHDQASLLNCVLLDAAEGLSGAEADLVMQIALALTRRDTKYITLLTTE